MLKYCAALWVLFAFLSSWARGQIPHNENKWEISVFFGLSALGEDTFVTPIEGGTTQMVGLEFESSYLVGARITENLGQHFGAELEYALANQPGSFVDLRPDLTRLDFDHKVHTFAYSILVYPMNRECRIRPFGSIGIGASFFQISGDGQGQALDKGVELKDRWKLALSYGGGVKLHINAGWGFRFDFRDHVTGVPDFGLPSQAPLLEGNKTGAGFRPDGNFHNWQISAGFMYSFSIR
ncbi:outer membrane beta-barrel protein [Acidobacteria bacterium AH-259-O06]|nr:outer membrane beta-barrel protein [Acidobacteria bacterium AH-259-O06]